MAEDSRDVDGMETGGDQERDDASSTSSSASEKELQQQVASLETAVSACARV